MQKKIRPGRFSEKELSIIRKLSEMAKKRFLSLNKENQKKLLKRAEEAAKRREQREGKKKEKKKKDARTKKEKEKKRTKDLSDPRHQYQPGRNQKARLQAYTATALERMLGSTGEEERQQDTEAENPENRIWTGVGAASVLSFERMGQGRYWTHSSLAQKQAKKHAIRKMAEKAVQKIKSFYKKIRRRKGVLKGMKWLANPLYWIAAIVLLLLIIVIFLVCGILLEMEEDTRTYQCQVSVQTESYRELVSEYCEKYGIDDYVDLCLAVMEQESGGRGVDVMQAEQSYHNTSPPIDTAEESIDCGVHEICDCLEKSKTESPDDIPAISLALQGYNYGNGYIEWALNYYNGYSLENAELFSQNMCASLGLPRYGDPEYVPHVLRYYVPNEETTVTNAEASKLIKELRENNKADAAVWKVIEKGASLTDTVTYGMLDPPRQDDGRDHPTVLDCSSFVAWSFHKAGYTGIPYESTTRTFIDSKKFETIKADGLQPGDIGLKSATAPTGGANHVGIYCGKLKNGTKVWLHCTSENRQSLTGNSSGVLISPYTNFTYFRRLKKWNKTE